VTRVSARDKRLRLGLLICVCAALTPRTAGQEPQPYTLTVDVPQVVLTVTVTGRDGAAVPGLQASDFAVYDEGELQQITAFSAQERPATVGLVLDNSRSMTPIRGEALRAAAAFVDVSNPEDDFFVIHFNERVRFGFGGGAFSTDRDRVRVALWQLRPDGQTALYDAVLAALRHATKGRWEKRALLVISDGGDTASRTSFDEALHGAREVGASIYAIGVYDLRDPERSPKVLRRLVRAGGGKAYFPDTASEMLPICRQIAAEIRSQYTLAFTPSDMGAEGRFHEIRVKLKEGKRLDIRTREGYYEPSGGD